MPTRADRTRDSHGRFAGRRDPRSADHIHDRGAPLQADETELRRELVYQLRYLQRLTINGIIRALRDMDPPIIATEATISEDIGVIMAEARRRYSLETFDPRDAITEVARAYDFILSRSLRAAITPGVQTRDQMRALAVATVANARKSELLQSVGLLRPPSGDAGGQRVSAREARALLEAAALPVLDGELVPAGELVE